MNSKISWPKTTKKIFFFFAHSTHLPPGWLMLFCHYHSGNRLREQPSSQLPLIIKQKWRSTMKTWLLKLHIYPFLIPSPIFWQQKKQNQEMVDASKSRYYFEEQTYAKLCQTSSAISGCCLKQVFNRQFSHFMKSVASRWWNMS